MPLMPCRVEQYFPPNPLGSMEVLLVGSVADGSVPPLDLLKLAGFLRKRGYLPRLCRDLPEQSAPHAVVLTSVFSWETPALRALAFAAQARWESATRILSGVLARRLGDGLHDELPVRVLDQASEDLLDRQAPDYCLAPGWDASIVITSKGVCPRECGHCSAARQGKGITKLIPEWHEHLDLALPRIEVWDNTLMLTPREHFSEVAELLRETGKPADLVCGLAPGGVDEAELRWRMTQLAGVPLAPVRLECNQFADLPRFQRLLEHARTVFGAGAQYRAFAVVNGSESPDAACMRVAALRSTGVTVDLVRYTPHDWEEGESYVNRAAGWSPESLLKVGAS